MPDGARIPEPLRRRYAGHDWQPVVHGRSGADVWRLAGRPALFAKLAPVAATGLIRELADEAARAGWLLAQGFPAPTVVDLDCGDGVCWLVTEALPGRPASDPWPADRRSGVIDAFADLARSLHALAPGDCPFDRRLATTVPAARAAAETGAVDLGDLDAERAGWTAAELVRALDAGIPSSEDIAVCHGDLCLPNVLLDDAGTAVTGIIDLGRLGRADRHSDLALAARSIAAEELNPQFGPAYAARFLSRYGEPAADPAKLDFYRLLDEFF